VLDFQVLEVSLIFQTFGPYFYFLRTTASNSKLFCTFALKQMTNLFFLKMIGDAQRKKEAAAIQEFRTKFM